MLGEGLGWCWGCSGGLRVLGEQGWVLGRGLGLLRVGSGSQGLLGCWENGEGVLAFGVSRRHLGGHPVLRMCVSVPPTSPKQE